MQSNNFILLLSACTKLELSFPDPPAIETRKRVLSDIEEDLRFESTRSRRGGRVQGHLTPQPVFHHQQNYSIFDFGAGGAGAGIPLKINSFLTTLHLGYGCKYLGIPILQSILSQCLLGERQDSGGSGGAGRLRDSKLISLDLYDISSFSRHNNEGQTFLYDLARMIVKAGNKLRYLGLRNFKAGLLDPSFIVILANGGEGKPVEKKEGVREEEDSNLIVEGTLSASNFSSLSSSSATSKDRNLHSSNNKTNTINSSHLQMLDLSLSDLGGHSPLLSTPTLLDALATNINSFPNLLALNLGWCKSVGKRELDHSAIGRLCSALADKHLSFSSAHDVPRPIDFKWLDIRGVEPFNHYGHFEMGTNDDVSTMETTIRCPVLTWMRNAFEDFPPLEELCRYFHDDIPLSGHKSIFTGRRLVKLLQMTSAGDGLL